MMHKMASISVFSRPRVGKAGKYTGSTVHTFKRGNRGGLEGKLRSSCIAKWSTAADSLLAKAETKGHGRARGISAQYHYNRMIEYN